MKQNNNEFNNEMGRFEMDFMKFMSEITSEYRKEFPDVTTGSVNFNVVVEVYFPVREDIRNRIRL